MTEDLSVIPGLAVTNFQELNDRVVAYPFPILHGFVTHPDGQSVKEVRLSRLRLPEQTTGDGDDDSEDMRLAVWPVVHRCFRGVVSLELGENHLTLTARLNNVIVTHHLTLFYEPAQNPANFVLPVYIVCSDSDGSFQAPDNEDCSVESAVRRISTGAGLLQSATADILVDEGFPKKTFNLLLDEKGLPICEIFRTRLKMSELYAEESDEKLWRFFQKELKDAFPAYVGKCKFMSFLADTRYHVPDLEPVPYLYEDVLKFVNGHVALGGSSLALCSTGCLYTWPQSIEELPTRLTDERSVDPRNFMDDSAYRGTRWACFSTTLGAACHELGHTFDLGHEPVGIMARGFDDIYKVFTSARPISVGDLKTSTDSSTAVKTSKVQSETKTVTHKEVSTTSASDLKVVETSFGSFKRQKEYIVKGMAEAPAAALEKTSFGAKMSGKFFSPKKKDVCRDQVVVTQRKSSTYDAASVPDMDSYSIQSSCAISLFDPDHPGDSCNVSTVSTRPSSMVSTTKKSRGLLKRLSLGGSDCEQFTQKTAVLEVKPTQPQNGSSKSIVTKHYNTYVVTSSSGMPVGGLDLSRPPSGYSVEDGVYGSSNHASDQKHKTIMEDKTNGEKSHKSPWSRLFSSKKKKDRLPEFTEVDEQQKGLATTHSPTNSDIDRAAQHPPTFHAGVIATEDVNKKLSTMTNSDSVGGGSETKTGSLTAVSSDPLPQQRYLHPAVPPARQLPTLSVNSCGVTTSESEEPCSPDSLEEYHFRFDNTDPYPKKYIATTITQDRLDEIRYVAAPPKNASPPAVDGGGDSAGATTTPEPDYVETSVQKIRSAVEIVKPQPTERGRRDGKKVVPVVPPAVVDNKSSNPSAAVKEAVKKPRRAEEILRRTNKVPEEETKEQREMSPDRPRTVLKDSLSTRRAKSEEDLLSAGEKKPVLPVVAGRKARGVTESADRGKEATVSQQQRGKDRSPTKAATIERGLNLSSAAMKIKENGLNSDKRIIGLPDPRAANTPQAFRYPVDDPQLTGWRNRAEPQSPDLETMDAPSAQQKNSEQRPRVDLRVPPASSRVPSLGASTDPHQPNVMTGSAKPTGASSKLRFPLRSSQAAKHDAKDDPREQKPQRSVMNLIPTRSTLSSRNKENKTALKSAETVGNHAKAGKTKSLTGTPAKQRHSFRRKSLGRNSSRKKRAVKEDTSSANVATLRKDKSTASRGSNLHLATTGPSKRLDFKQMNESSNNHARPTHHRSASRDSIGQLGSFLMAEVDFVDGKVEMVDGHTSDDTSSSTGVTLAEPVITRGTLPRKQHCSSLINTPSGISVMEEVSVPHRLPLPVAPPRVPTEGGDAVVPGSGGPKWTRNCAALLSYHKWFNPHAPTDPKTPPHLDGHVLSAAGGLRLIELRDVCGNALQHWEYPEGIRSAPTTFKLPLSPPQAGSSSEEDKVVVVAIDVYGNMIHRTVRGAFQ
ncbi:hypothetical protein BV898_01019 [Hypsibius exemplaris]|uniref:Zinc metalloproteinase n=1 Tax=Hypsibius exemplaris TaxID=2072580 RepID=A0A1W0XD61_HYPEX|nr:hypothetical protein BV898_01019 [Hypsibius exemplaris]